MSHKKYLAAGIYEEYWEHTLEGAMIGFMDIPEARKIIEGYIHNFDKVFAKGISLFLTGGHGVRKTGLSIEILKLALKANKTGKIVSFPRLIDLFLDKREDARRQLESVRKLDLLIVDDLGKEAFYNIFKDNNYFSDLSGSMQNITFQVLEYLFKYRTNRLKPSILISNISDLGILSKRYGSSIISLLSGRFISIVFPDRDYRKTQYDVLLKELLCQK